MSSHPLSRLRFNFGFLLESPIGTSREMELDYPSIIISEDVTLSPLQGKFNATRISEGVFINGRLNSTVATTCMRCLDDITSPISFELDELFYYPAETTPEGSYAWSDTGFIDLSPLVRELSLLEIPIKPVCREDCQGLCMVCGQNLNEAGCGCEEDNIDPRLAKLKSLLED
ncbi:MAG: DUF177 domain-containing protein [Anaerolineae bacterium]